LDNHSLSKDPSAAQLLTQVPNASSVKPNTENLEQKLNDIRSGTVAMPPINSNEKEQTEELLKRIGLPDNDIKA
jgi:hypothetical protein